MTAKEILDLLSSGGVLAFAVLAIWAFFTERVIPRSRLEDQRTEAKSRLEEQRTEKLEAMAMAKGAVASMDRLSDAVEARNRLEEQRLQLEIQRRS